MMKKTISLSLALLIAVSLLLTSCGNNDSKDIVTTTVSSQDQADNTPDTSGQAEETATVDADGWVEIKDDLPEDLKYEGQYFNILVRDQSPFKEEFDIMMDDGSLMGSAVFNRNTAVEEKLGIMLTFETRFGDYSQYKDFNNLVYTSVASGSHTYDAVAAMAGGTMSEVQRGTYTKLNDLDYLDLDKKYWNQSVVEQYTINDALYMITGSISPQLIGQSIVFFENLKLANDYGIESVYNLVNEKKWTHEKLLELTKNIYIDADSNGERNKADIFGLTVPFNSQVDAFYASYDVPISKKDNSGNLVFAFEEDKVIDLYEKLYALLISSEGTWGAKDYADDYATDYLTNFASDKALFTVNRLNTVQSALNDMTSDYAILPYPMADENQGEYTTYAWNQYSMISIPKDANSVEMSGAVLEAMGSSSYNIVTPAYYETALKYRYSRDADSSKMLDIITGNVRIEYHYLQSSGLIFFIRDQIKSGAKSISSAYKALAKANQKTFEKDLEKWPK